MSRKEPSLTINNITYTAGHWPAQMPNPGRNKFLIYRNGVFVATAKTKKQFEENCRNGWYDACMDEPEEKKEEQQS